MTEDTKRGVSRRTLAKGVAWSVPAAALVSAAPAYAASPGCVSFTFGPSSCKNPGTPFGYNLSICVSSTCPETVFPLTVTRIDTNNGTYLTETQWGGPNSPGSPDTTAVISSTTCVLVDGFAHGSASTLTISYTTASGTNGTFTLDAPPSTGGCSVVGGTTTTTTTAATTTTTTTAATTTTTTTAATTTTTTTV